MPASSSLYDLLLQTDGSRRHAGQAINLDTTATLTAAVSGAIDSSANTPGDEGEIFSARVRGLIPASSASSENDHHQINLNGTAAGNTFSATKNSRQESHSTEQMRLSVSISRTLSRKLKLLAHDQEMTVSALLLELIKAEAHKYEVNGA